MKKSISQATHIIFAILLSLSFVSIVGAQSASTTVQGLKYSGTYCPSGFNSTINASSSNIGDLLKFVTCLIEVSFIPLLFAIATIVFVYGVVKFIGNEESAEKEDGKQFMLWGVIALAVMFSVWGLVRIFNNTFGVANIIPQLPSGK